MAIVGSPHPVLLNQSSGRKYIENLLNTLQVAGVEILGFLSESKLDELIQSHTCIAILPYLQTSGSSYAATFLMEHLIPVVTSDLIEFSVLKQLGAGFIGTSREVDRMIQAIKDTLGDVDSYNRLVMKCHSYCQKYNVKNFINELS